MNSNRVVVLCCAVAIACSLAGCSRQQSDWQKTRETNTADGYEQFLKKYPSGEFTAQAQARVKELYEERDWQKARDADTPEAYQAFLKQYPEGKWTEEARIRVENFTLAQAPGAGGPAASSGSPSPGADSSAAASDATPSETPQPTSSAAAAPPLKATPPPKAASKAAETGSGTYAVQLGAFKTGAKAADDRWSRLQKEYPTVLQGLSSKVSPKKTAEGTLYRLQAVGLTEKRARAVCSALKVKSQDCVVVPPTHG
ncbi:MAG: SPOR domain-containing protein [Pseudomonadota bacterium]|nr:SPOR domain-containing protein [Pseudomonadota bacterium]